MRKYSIDTVFRLRLRHQMGQLARLAGAIAEEGGLLGDITTLRIGEQDVVRDITVETENEEHTRRIVAAIHRVEGIEFIKMTDRVFERHQGGKLHNTSRVEIRGLRDLRYIYTPGVARVAEAISQEPERARELTGIGNSVGVFTNGSRVLSLGNLGPVPSMPVMEGKAVLYDKFSGISATPILVNTLDPKEFVDTVVRISPTFGGIHLEDIRTPDCFEIERALRERLYKPVMHDDQHGTATAALAAILNACKLTGVDLRRSTLGQIGLGAAGRSIARLALAYGVGEVLVTDVSPEAVAAMLPFGAKVADLSTLLKSAQIVVATTGKAGLIAPSMVRKHQVIFALSNPEPEIAPDDAKAAGAAFAGDGRSINNALAFPGLFKGALTARSRSIEVEMLLAAAEAIAAAAEPGEIVPSPLNPHVHEAVARAAASSARALGLENTARI